MIRYTPAKVLYFDRCAVFCHFKLCILHAIFGKFASLRGKRPMLHNDPIQTSLLLMKSRMSDVPSVVTKNLGRSSSLCQSRTPDCLA